MRRIITRGILSLFLFGNCLLFPVLAGNRITLRCADVHNPDYPTVRGVMYMARLVKERTQGRINIIVYPNGSLGSEKAVVAMVQLGALEMGRISLSEAVEVYPAMEVLTLPYIFRNDQHKWRVLEGPIGKNLLEGLAGVNLVGLCFQESGYRSFYNARRPIYHPADLKGLKIRVQPSKTMVEFIEFLGAAAVPINYNEVFSALKAGAVDGAENNLPSFLTSQHYQIAGYYSLDRHASIPELLFLSKKIWSGFSAADREIIRRAAAESVYYQRRLWAKFENESMRKLQQAGCRFNAVDLEAFQNECRAFYQIKNYKYQSLVDQINQVN